MSICFVKVGVNSRSVSGRTCTKKKKDVNSTAKMSQSSMLLQNKGERCLALLTSSTVNAMQPRG